jgi:hypothetical protein
MYYSLNKKLSENDLIKCNYNYKEEWIYLH